MTDSRPGTISLRLCACTGRATPSSSVFIRGTDQRSRCIPPPIVLERVKSLLGFFLNSTDKGLRLPKAS